MEEVIQLLNEYNNIISNHGRPWIDASLVNTFAKRAQLEATIRRLENKELIKEAHREPVLVGNQADGEFDEYDNTNNDPVF